MTASRGLDTRANEHVTTIEPKELWPADSRIGLFAGYKVCDFEVMSIVWFLQGRVAGVGNQDFEP